MKRIPTTITLCLLAATSVYSQHTEAGEPDIKVGRLTTMSPIHGNGWEQKLVDIYRFEGDGRTSADDYNVTHKAPCHKSLYINHGDIYPQHSFAIEPEESSLISFEYADWPKLEFKATPVKVPQELADSLYLLNWMAVYSSAYQEEQHMFLDGGYALFVHGDNAAEVHTPCQSADEHLSLLVKTFGEINRTLYQQKYDQLPSFIPTVNRLLAHFRQLLPRDVYRRMKSLALPTRINVTLPKKDGRPMTQEEAWEYIKSNHLIPNP